MKDIMQKLLDRHLIFSKRYQNLAISYLFSIMITASKHTLTHASSVTDIDKSQYSRFLSNHQDIAKDSLDIISKSIAKEISGELKPLVLGTKYKVGIIVDATLHQRSTLRTDNSQRFNHGQGFIVGHQWTNVVLILNDLVIPLPPIAFYGKKKCKELGIEYKTEHQKLIEYLKDLNLFNYVGYHDPEEVICLLDAGYDNKNIQQTIANRGWKIVCALKKTRATRSSKINNFMSVEVLFNKTRKQSPWKSVYIHVDVNGKRKRRRYRTRQITGEIKGLPNKEVTLICSEKSKGKGKIYFLSTDLKLTIHQITMLYRKRWAVELFHKDVKSYLGFEDLGAHEFDSQESHVYWVYCAYLLLYQLELNKKVGIKKRQEVLKSLVEISKAKHEAAKVVQMSTQFKGREQIRKYFNKILDLQRVG